MEVLYWDILISFHFNQYPMCDNRGCFFLLDRQAPARCSSELLLRFLKVIAAIVCLASASER